MVTVATLANKTVRNAGVEPAMYDFVLPKTLMGVEVEVDSDSSNMSTHPYESNLAYWNRHHDGSLSNGYEYTLRMPLAGNVLSAAISQLYAYPSDFKRTFTGSTHIHIDMLEEEVTLDVLRTLVLMVYTLEPVLYNVGDNTREWCGYANSLKSADPMLLSTLFSEQIDTQFSRTYRRGGSLGRYYGLNLAALTDYGSLEFRYFPTARSPEELVRWINLVQSFKKAALAIGTPEMLANIINDEAAYMSMIDTYFAPYADVFRACLDWRRVHSMFSKANIVSKDSMLRDIGTFNYRQALAGDRFNNLITFPEPSNIAAELRTTVVSNGRVPPDATDGTFLLYVTYIYLRRQGQWWSLHEGSNGRDIQLSEDELATLAYIQENMASHLNSMAMQGVEWTLLNKRICPNNVAYFDGEYHSYEEDADYDEDEEEDDF